ncbi:MAG: hypothetical protein GTO17_06880 [Candidatus Aminicenantes bacterium]|nr:hypothetical protein [Candidatus Aminicenantes bacterium]
MIRPRQSFIQLREDPKALGQGLKAILLIGGLYTFTVTGLALVDAEIMAPGVLKIPGEAYYFWEIFFTLPVMISGWILAAGIIQLLSRAFQGRGTFEVTLALLGFAITLPMFMTWIPETIGTIIFLTGLATHEQWVTLATETSFGKVFNWVYQLLFLIWLMILVPLAVSIAQKLRLYVAAGIGFLSLIIFMAFVLVFIR